MQGSGARLSKNGAIILFLNNGVVFCEEFSDGLAELLGYSREQLMLKEKEDAFAFVLEQEKERIVADFVQAAKDKREFCKKYRINKEDGTILWISLAANPVVTEEGSVRFYCVLNDISESERESEGFTAEWNRQTGKRESEHAHDSVIMDKIFQYLYSTDDFDLAVKQILELLGRHYNVSRSYIFEDNNAHTEMRNTYEWCADGIKPEIDNLQHVSYENDTDNTYATLFNDNNVCACPDISVLPDASREYLEKQGIKGILMCNILGANGCIGMVGFDDCLGEIEWTDEMIGTLSLAGMLLGVFLSKRRAENDANFSDDFLRALNDNASYIYIIDPENYRIIYTNKSFDERFGDHFKGCICYEEALGLQKPCEECMIAQMKDNEVSKPVEIRRKDGAWMLSQANCINWNGKKMYMITCTDISAQKTAEEKEHQAWQDLESLMNSVPGGIISYDYDDTTKQLEVRYLNDEMVRLSGSSREVYIQALKDKDFALLFEEDIQIIQEKVHNIKKGERASVTKECRIKSQRGISWVQMNAIIEGTDNLTARIYIVLLDINARKTAEQMVASRNESLAIIDNSVSAGTIINSIHFRQPPYYVSKNIQSFLGYSVEEFMQFYKTSYQKVIHPDDFERVLGLNFKYEKELPKQYDMEFRFVRKDKTVFWVVEKATYIENYDGHHAYLSVFVDITKQKEMMEQIHVQEEAYRIAVKHSNSLVYIYNMSRQSISLPGEKTEQALLSRVAPESMETVKQLCKSMDEGKEAENTELRFLNNDGEYRWYRTEYSVLLSSDGNPDSAILSLTEIEKEKKMQAENAAVRLDRDILFAATRTVFPLCISINLSNNCYTMLECKGFGVNGYEESGNYDELIQKSSLSMPNGDDAKFIDLFSTKSLRNAYESGQKIVTLTHRQYVSDGQIHWLRTAVVFVDNEINDDIICVALSENIDLQKNTEAELMERETQLQDALAQAQKANRAKSDFLSNMSHDLRTPLNAIINLAYLGLDDITQEDKVCDDLLKIGTAGEFMLGLINDILDMTRIENGRIELHPSLYSHKDFLKYVTTVIEPQCIGKDIALIINCKETDILLWVDKIRLNQIFFNILSNAVKFTAVGGQIEYKEVVHRVEDDKVYFECVITDNGCGMSKEFQKKMFLPFEQENNNNSRIGTGLGLRITKNLIEMMGGSIEIKSEKGVGTSVHICLIADRATKEQAGERATEVTKPVLSAAEDKSTGDCILVVEDNEINLIIACRVLQKFGYQVETAENGQEAVGMYKSSNEGHYAAILMDVRMPVMDGLEATAQIRIQEKGRKHRVPIIAMTANAFDEDVKDCLKSGMDAFLSKPLEIEKLREMLASYVGPSKRNREFGWPNSLP